MKHKTNAYFVVMWVSLQTKRLQHQAMSKFRRMGWGERLKAFLRTKLYTSTLEINCSVAQLQPSTLRKLTNEVKDISKMTSHALSAHGTQTKKYMKQLRCCLLINFFAFEIRRYFAD